MERLLYGAGTLLVMLGLAAWVFGWEALMWLPRAAVEAVRAEPWSLGLVAAGVGLMVLAGLVRRWRG